MYPSTNSSIRKPANTGLDDEFLIYKPIGIPETMGEIISTL